MEWTRILAYITETVDQQLLLRNEYLVAENRILKAQLQGRLRLLDAGRARLGEIDLALRFRAVIICIAAARQDPSRAEAPSSSRFTWSWLHLTIWPPRIRWSLKNHI